MAGLELDRSKQRSLSVRRPRCLADERACRDVNSFALALRPVRCPAGQGLLNAASYRVCSDSDHDWSHTVEFSFQPENALG